MTVVDSWPLPITSLSPSSMSNFQRCPEEWRRKYIKGEWKFDASASSVMGNAVHGSAEENYSQKRFTGVDLTVDEVEEAYAASFDKEVEVNGGPSEINWTIRIGKEKVRLRPGEAKDRGVPLARQYRESVSPHVQPLGTEEWFAIEVPGSPVPIRGKIDLITETKKTDLKFSAQLKTRPEPSWRLQALTYLLVDKTTEKDGTVRIDSLEKHDFEWHTGTFGGMRSIPRVVTPADEPALSMKNDATSAQIAHKLIASTVQSMLACWERFGSEGPWPAALQHTWACNVCNFHPNRGGNCYWWVGEPEPDYELITLF
jgi:hypothetical protein